MGNALQHRVEIWKKQLLDLGKRNRLINFKEGKRNNVKITSPSIEQMYNSLVSSERSLKFPYAERIEVDEDGEESYDAVIAGDIETSRSIGDLQKTLRALRLKAKTSIEEQGINILYLTFGSIQWRESEHSEIDIVSPIVLVPVSLTIESATSPFVLSLHEDEIVVNPSLIYKFESDFGIKIPEFDSTNDDIMKYLQKVESLMSNKGWRVTTDMHLTILSFLKINMYKDLDKHSEKLNNNGVVSAIAGESDAITIPSELNDYDHDNKTKPIDTYQVVDADSSQQDAVLLSKAGTSFVLQGPPGTGKSQTITNIISEALADGKKVLFVSEKMAALQVVYNRLSAVGLSDFCFALHSHKAKKQDILRELSNSVSINKTRVREEILSQLDNLERKRSSLNEYQTELHTPYSGLNCTIFEINGRLAKLPNIPDIIFDIDSIDKVTPSELNERCYTLSELIKTLGIDESGCLHNVWRNANIRNLTNELRHDITSNISLLVPSLERIDEIYAEYCEKYNLSLEHSLAGVDKLTYFVRFISNSPILPVEWVYNNEIDKLLQIANECVEIAQEIHSLQGDEHISIFDSKILELDITSLLMRFRGEYSSFFRIFNSRYKKDVQMLRQYTSNFSKLNYKFILETLSKLRSLSEKIDLLNSHKDTCIAYFANYYKSERTDWQHISRALSFAKELKLYVDEYNLPEALIHRICQDREFIKQCKDDLCRLELEQDSCAKSRDWVFAIFDENENFINCNLTDLTERFKICNKRKDQLEQWVDYHSYRQKCKEMGLSDYISKIEESNVSSAVIVDAYLKRFYRLWLDAALSQFPHVLSFRGRVQEQTIAEFKELDKTQFKIAQSRVRERVMSRMPDFNAITSTRDEIGILKRELNKQRKIMPLRKLFKAIPNLITSLRPCFMMSPLSVSLFLEADSYEFDMVIFDEASQVHTEDAIGAIMRSKQVIIVGDTKQLPPTNFFASTVSDEGYDTDDESEDDDAGAYQSILDESVAVLPERSLRWHYRSRHEDLITFSNVKIYNNSLITFPSSVEKAKDCGVEYIHVADGVYDRGKKRCNMIEAKRVAALVIDHFCKYPNRSLGVVTFSEAQMQAVDAAIRHLRQSNPQYDKYFAEDREDSFFIKNIENVQGDERDTIIFSIGYARDVNGNISMNFGALNKEGGHRRLNVAITRAKYNIKLVGSIVPTDIDLDKTSAEGVRLLRSYIEFAQQGVVALQKELTYGEALDFDSPFEEAVYDFLVSKGYNVTTQVGCSGFRIDMAVKHPQKSGIFAIGIECDGATYHSSRTARERDRLRQEVLESMGWKIHRIWSTDWIKDQKSEEEKLVIAVEKAMESLAYNFIPKEIEEEDDTSIIELTDIEEEVERVDITESASYGFIPYIQTNIYEYWSLEVSNIIKKIIELEQPIHFDELCRRAAPMYGNQKVTIKIRNEVEYHFNRSLRNDIQRKDDFVSLVDSTNLQVRIPNETNGYIRNIIHISPDELALAMKIIAEHSFGITPEDLVIVTARELGFKRTSDKISTILHNVYNQMLVDGIVREVDGKVNVI